jgi:hypothetical protein
MTTVPYGTRSPRVKPLPGRFLHTGLHPNPIDTWALARWNAGIEAAREEYDYLISVRGFGGILARQCTTPGCRTNTRSEAGVCGDCRRLAELRPNGTAGYWHCETEGCTHTTQHETRVCWTCRVLIARVNRAHEWTDCVKPGCGRATQSPTNVCSDCRRHVPPTGPGFHWSRRYRNVDTPTT